uniref:CCHC-type domain-containing protein n=1 Tax=Tanacetum cinerariifolium TaxID=118510 RepID=A0A699KXW8_TANCI|nr:hypothetical protein [Tanacetum cinerariifolium]
MTDYSLWEVIKNGNKVMTKPVGSSEQTYEPTTAKEKQDKRNEMKVRGTLLMAHPNKDQLKFYSYQDAKLLMEAIEKRYGGNKESKKSVGTSGRGHSARRHELKRLRSLPSERKTHALIWRNNAELETISLDDLYNNLKIYEPEILGSSSTNQNPQNMAFVSSKSTSSTNEADTTASGVSTAHTQEDLEQIDPDDLKEMDLHWEMAMLTIRARRFMKRTGRSLDMNGRRIGFNKTKVECFNCHKNNHFVRECRALRNQDNRGREYERTTILVETPTENALIAQDGIGGESVDVSTVLSSADKTVKTVDITHKGVLSTEESKSVMKNNFGPPIIKDWHSDDDSEDKLSPTVDVKTVKPSVEKIDFVKTPRETVKTAESHKSHKHYPRGNKRNWNNLMSYRLGSNFKMINKACYVCGSFEHL